MSDICTKCKKAIYTNSGEENPWCSDCYYPGINDDYSRFREMLEEGYRYIDAAVNSGYRGIEEFDAFNVIK